MSDWYEGWKKENEDVFKKLDSIDLTSEMKQREKLYDFMDRLEEKYPYEPYGLFNNFSPGDFEEYLFQRYGINYVEEETIKYIHKIY